MGSPKPIVGVNDLQTVNPALAKEADGWDPKKYKANSNKKMPWICDKNHKWEISIGSRNGKKTGCPYCSGRLAITGENDLQTVNPELAKEADGWDPSTVLPNSNKKRGWKCKKGHKWDAHPNNRTNGKGCPYCNGLLVITGENDLQTVNPELAKEADGWDPSTVLPNSNKKRGWKCKKGHKWDAHPANRTMGKGCPYCANQKVLTGFNDLKTKFPIIAKEANGWDPRKVLPSLTKSKPWKCECGYEWSVSPKVRTSNDPPTGCPKCADYGYNPGKTGYFYLMERDNELQFGISNNLKSRLRFHRKEKWKLLEKTEGHDGKKVLDTETILKRWLKKEIGTVPGKEENWYKSDLNIKTLKELKIKSSIQTSIF